MDLVTDQVLSLQPSTVTREDLLDAFPLKPHELLRDTTDRVFGHLQKLAGQHPDDAVWIVDAAGSVAVKKLREVADPTAKSNDAKRLKDELQWKTILLGEKTGGLSNGLLDGSSKTSGKGCDIADEWRTTSGRNRRQRVLHSHDSNDDAPTGMRLALKLILRDPDVPVDTPDNIDAGVENFEAVGETGSETSEPATNKPTETDARSNADIWEWYVLPRSADDDAISWQAPKKQRLIDHLVLAGQVAERFVEKLGLESSLSSAIVTAAKFHDIGKDRRLWQLGIGNREYDTSNANTILAKSNRSGRPVNRHYRHEFGTLLDITSQRNIHDSDAMKKLVDEV